MTLSSTEIVAIIVALGAVIVNIITAIRMGNKVETISQVTARSLVETGVLQSAVKEVHILTNQNLSDVRNELKQSNAEIASLREVVVDLKSEREKTATEKAYNTPVGTRQSRASDVTTESPMPVKVIAEEPIPVEVQDHPVEKKPPKK